MSEVEKIMDREVAPARRRGLKPVLLNVPGLVVLGLSLRGSVD